MKGLTGFFDWKRFAEGKTFMAINLGENIDYETKQHIGSKVEVVITEDNTQYKCKPGKEYSNLYEKITFKALKDVKVPLNSYVIPIDAVASIWDNDQKLSVTCADIQIVTPKEK